MRKFRILLLFLAVMLLAACHQPKPTAMQNVNAVYYWRTDLRLDSVERDFLGKHHIQKVYCRYFDVVMNSEEEGPVPNATITFSDTLPEGIEIVPTVYITENCMHQKHKGLAEKLVRRIQQMNETNDIHAVREIQIDCDYTARSRQTFYEFLKEAVSCWQLAASEKEPIANNQKPITNIVSATIRLHQLQITPPPVDYGVLMVYNTGDPQRFMERNPILDLRDVKPYLRWLDDYALPLAAAYPVFSWQRTIHNVEVTHTVSGDEILRVKQVIEETSPRLRHSIITYHLDNENIKRYKPDTYEKIYHH